MFTNLISKFTARIRPIKQYVDNILKVPSETIMTNLSLRTEYFPSCLHDPTNFVFGSLFMILYIIFYASDIVFHLIGTTYPILYGLYLFECNKNDENQENEETQPINKLIIMNKYWMLFASMIFIESVGNFILQLVPFYSYGKIFFVYLLIRNDFVFTNTVFEILKKTYSHVNQYFQINEVVGKIKIT